VEVLVVANAKVRKGRLLAERAVPADGEEPRRRGRPPLGTVRARSVTVNLADSPLGWLRARGHVSPRQFEAGEALRSDWERAQLSPRVTMRWDASPPDRNARGSHDPAALAFSAVKARQRFESAMAAVGPGLRDILWRIACAGEGMREAESALGWPARAGKLVLGLALDRLADHYRMR
jgi:hypothetical protein